MSAYIYVRSTVAVAVSVWVAQGRLTPIYFMHALHRHGRHAVKWKRYAKCMICMRCADVSTICAIVICGTTIIKEARARTRVFACGIQCHTRHVWHTRFGTHRAYRRIYIYIHFSNKNDTRKRKFKRNDEISFIRKWQLNWHIIFGAQAKCIWRWCCQRKSFLGGALLADEDGEQWTGEMFGAQSISNVPGAKMPTEKISSKCWHDDGI